MPSRASASERCACGRYELERWCGTYSTHESTHTRECCYSSPGREIIKWAARKFVACGPGYSGTYDTEREARAVVATNGTGAVYRKIGGAR
jgi:hypothetical protein